MPNKHYSICCPNLLDCFTVLGWGEQDCQWDMRHCLHCCAAGHVIGWSNYRHSISYTWHSGLMSQVKISTIYKGHWQSPCTALTAGKCLPLKLCKETVKESSNPLSHAEESLDINTLKPQQHGWHFCSCHFHFFCIFIEWKIIIFAYNFPEVCSQGFNWQLFSIGSSDGLAPK